MEYNQSRVLAFADHFIDAVLVENAVNYRVNDAVIINLDASPMVTGAAHPAMVPGWKSTRLIGGMIQSAKRVAVIKVKKTTNLGGVQFRGWDWLGRHIRSFPRDTPLFKSPQDHVGYVTLDPKVFCHETSRQAYRKDFAIKLNLWWAPGHTDCFIHNEHPFLEVHTQIWGLGRMQKFHAWDEETLYEDVVMAMGYTHDPFCRVDGDNRWIYPWHRYWADTESVWLAIELHPL